jgi:alkaline phosphatase D
VEARSVEEGSMGRLVTPRRRIIANAMNTGVGPSRRTVLRAGAGLAAAMLAPEAARRARGEAPFAADPFKLGIASGSPTPDGVVLWTRLVPDLLAEDGGMTPEPVAVGWEVAADAGFRDIVQHGSATALPGFAHSVHVDVRGLAPARWYWYRFHAGDRGGAATSPVGRTRTAPAADATPERLRFAFASCQQFEHGYYAAYRHMAAEDLDLVIFLGDYIYEASWGRLLVRNHETPEATTLPAYRARYALYKGDPDLQAAHAAFPWISTWDDHEVANDYANATDEALDPEFLARRAAAYRAYWEHMPLRQPPPEGPNLLLYTHVDFGRLARFHVLDDRQYRDRQACQPPGRGGSSFVADCAERLDPARTILGPAQERWLDDGLARSPAQWNVLAQQTLMAQLDRLPGLGRRFWTDGWDGYPAARRRLLESIVARRAANPLVIGGDVHSTWAADLKLDFDDPRTPAVAAEVCGTSITSQGPSQARTLALLADNPHIKFADSEKRGYISVALTRREARAALRAVDDVRQRDATIATAATFVVEDGRPGVQLG